MDVLQEMALIILPVFFSGLTFIAYLKWNKIAFLNYPLDFHQEYKGQRIFGDNKTLKGPVLMGMFTGLYGAYIYYLLGTPYQLASIFLLFCIIGLSYSIGELPNSFIKRQIGIKPGMKASTNPAMTIFYVTDIFDSLLAVALSYYLLMEVQTISIVLAIFIGGALHVLTDKLMKSLKLKE